jgi:3-oxoacyl-[acyl-carrier protein] reductase
MVTDPVDRKVALLTNASGYAGPALSRVLAREGFDQVLHVPAHHHGGPAGEVEPQRLVDTARAYDAQVHLLDGVDLTTAEGNQALVQAAFDRFGRLDAACLVGGVILGGPFLQETGERWERLKHTNLDPVFHGLQAVLAPMVAAGRGQVVVFTSATGARPEPGASIYSATRACANALVRAVGLEVAASGVTVNAIGTNFMDFPGFHAAVGTDDPARRAKLEARVPARRMGTMEELAEFAIVLLDGRSRFQTGQFFSYSGGWSP